MGRFFNNLKGQIGRDTGKALSGLVYGDKHATVYRRVNNSNSTSTRETKDDREERLEQERIQNELFTLSKNIQERVDLIINEEIPKEEKELSIYLRKLLTQMQTCMWKSNLSDTNKITNNLSDAIYFKYNEALFYLTNNHSHNKQIDYFIKQSKSLKNRRFFLKNISILGIILFVLVFMMSLLIFN